MATEVGTIAAGVTPVSMVDNGVYMLVVNGGVPPTECGWKVDIATHVFSVYDDPNFLGANAVWFLDTFFLFNQPGTQFWYQSESNSISINGLAIAAKTTYQDNTANICIVRQNVWVFGTQRATEIWYNAGGSPFSFQRAPQTLIEHACGAVYSPIAIGLAMFWLAVDQQGKGVLFRGEGFDAKRISTWAIENELRQYPRLDDALSFSYQIGGHYFWVLVFPTADKCWVFDDTTQQFHEWLWLDGNGELHRPRATCHTYGYGKNIVGDWENGKLYELSFDALTDASGPIMRLRSWPHNIMGIDWQGQAISADGKTLIHNQFIADIEVGTDTPADEAVVPQISLRWSDTRGASWGNAVMRGIGAGGQYLTQPQWRQLGLARDRIYELSWSEAVVTALNGGYVDSRVLGK